MLNPKADINVEKVILFVLNMQLFKIVLKEIITMEIQQVILEKNVPCKMRDGVTLYADVYRPNVEGNIPCFAYAFTL